MYCRIFRIYMRFRTSLLRILCQMKENAIRNAISFSTFRRQFFITIFSPYLGGNVNEIVIGATSIYQAIDIITRGPVIEY